MSASHVVIIVSASVIKQLECVTRVVKQGGGARNVTKSVVNVSMETVVKTMVTVTVSNAKKDGKVVCVSKSAKTVLMV